MGHFHHFNSIIYYVISIAVVVAMCIGSLLAESPPAKESGGLIRDGLVELAARIHSPAVEQTTKTYGDSSDGVVTTEVVTVVPSSSTITVKTYHHDANGSRSLVALERWTPIGRAPAAVEKRVLTALREIYYWQFVSELRNYAATILSQDPKSLSPGRVMSSVDLLYDTQVGDALPAEVNFAYANYKFTVLVSKEGIITKLVMFRGGRVIRETTNNLLPATK